MNKTLLGYDLMLHLADHENNALAIQEAIASKLPFISTPTGDHQSFQNENCGYVTSSFNPFEIAREIAAFVEDEIAYEKLIQNINNKAVNTWKSNANKFVGFVEKVCYASI